MNTENSTHQVRRLSLVADDRETVAGYLRRWITGRRALRPSTVTSYQSTIEKYLIPHLGDIELRFLLASDIDAMYQRILATGSVGVRTVTRIHATLMSALNSAVRTGQLERNQAELVELPRSTQFSNNTWNATQLGEFLRAIKDDELFALYALLALRGLRRGEALGLQWRDLKFGEGQIRVERQVTGSGSTLNVGDPKSSSGIRTIAIDTRLVAALQAQQIRRASQLGRAQLDTDWVFGDDEGGPVRPIDATRRFQRLVKRSGLPPIRLHDLRHTSATLGLATGESLLEVSRRLGHSSVVITGDIYSDVSPELARTAAERLANHIWDDE